MDDNDFGWNEAEENNSSERTKCQDEKLNKVQAKLEEKIEELKLRCHYLTFLLILVILISVDALLFKYINNGGACVVIAIFEAVGVLLYAKQQDYQLFISLWKEIISMFKK